MKTLEYTQADWVQFNQDYLIGTQAQKNEVFDWVFKYWSPDPGFYVQTAQNILQQTTDFTLIYNTQKKNYIDLRRFTKNTLFFGLLQIPRQYQKKYIIWRNQLETLIESFQKQYPEYEIIFSDFSKTVFWPDTCKIQISERGQVKGITLFFQETCIWFHPKFTENPGVTFFPLSFYQRICEMIKQQICKQENHNNQVDIIYLDPTKPFEHYLDSLSKLNSPFIKIQLAPNFQNKDLLIKVYNALKETDVTVLLAIPSLPVLQELQVRSSDGIFLDVDTNGDDLFDLLVFCQQQNYRTILRVTSNQKLSFAAGIQLYFPSLPVFIRTDDIDFELAYTFFKDKALYLDLPLCLAQQYNIPVSLKALKDVVAFLDSSGYYPAQVNTFLQAYQKKKSECLTCSNSKNCFGYLKNNLKLKSLIISQQNTNSLDYLSIADRVLQIKPVDSQVISFDPENYQQTAGSAGVQAIHQMQKTRLEKKFSGKNFYYIWDFQHSCYFNRPLEVTELFKPDPRGLISLNWQFIGIDNPEMLWKQKCDLLLPKHGFTITTQISFDKHWTTQNQNDLDQFTLKTLQDLILQAGGDPKKLIQIGNDLLYNGKKFCGKEWLFVPNIGYIENTVVTCEYLPEKPWFDKLYHHSKEKPITGITEEVPGCTKEYLIWGLHEQCNKFFRGF